MNKKENYHNKFSNDDLNDDEKILSEYIADNEIMFSKKGMSGGKIINKDIKIPTYRDLNSNDKIIGAGSETKTEKSKSTIKQEQESAKQLSETKTDQKSTMKEEQESTIKQKSETKTDQKSTMKEEQESTIKQLSPYERHKIEKMKAKPVVLNETGVKFMESVNSDGYLTFVSSSLSSKSSKSSQSSQSSQSSHFEDDQIGAVDGKIVTIGTNEFLKLTDTVPAKDILMESYNAGNSSIKLYQNTKSNIISQHPNYKNEINYMSTQPIKNVANTPFDTYIRFALTSNYLNKFMKPLVYRRKDLKLVTKGSECKDYINLIKLPKETAWLINHIQLYFQQVKNDLVLNENTGYYMMNVSIEDKEEGKTINVEFPVMCKHIFMTYDGRSLDEISEECSRAGICKYCGDSLVSSAIDDTTQLPPVVTDLIYKLIDLFDGDVSDQDYFIRIFNNFSKIVNKFVKTDDTNYINKASATAALYTYKIVKDALKKGLINELSTGVIMKKILENSSLIGWDINKMDELINRGIIQDTTDFINVLKNDTKIKIEGLTLNDVFKISTEDIKKLKDENKLELLRQVLNDENYQTILLNTSTKIKDLTVKNLPINVESTDYEKTESFAKIVKSWCPENVYHEFKSGTCSKCGIKENLSNVETIYKKYEKKFINNFDFKTENKFSIASKIEIVNVDSLISQNKDIQTYFMKKLDLSNKDYQDFIKSVCGIKRIIINTLEVLLGHTNKPLDKLNIEELLSLVVYVDKNGLSDTLVPSLSLVKYSVDEFITSCGNYDYEDIDSDDD